MVRRIEGRACLGQERFWSRGPSGRGAPWGRSDLLVALLSAWYTLS